VDPRRLLMAMALACAAVPAAAAPVAAITNASGRATLLIPLTLTKIDDLDFGTMVSSGTSGTVALNAITGNRAFAGGVTAVPSAPGHRATFAGAGSPSQQVIITINPPATLANTNGDTIDVLALTLDGGPIRSIDPVSRAFFVGVGGILMLSANQPDGDYSANFSVTAQYQ
jgi:hypothetical protein